MSCHLAPHYLLTLLVAVYLLVSVEACMQTAVQHVRMSPSRILANEKVKSAGGGCRCCQLCRRNPECSSYRVNTAKGKCQLYDRVGTYTTVTVDTSREWRYFVMPGHSGPGGFCRHDSDCQQQGERCRGRVCTTLTSVTCRDIYRTLGFSRWIMNHATLKMVGWLDGREIPLLCVMDARYGGLTMLLLSSTQRRLDERTLMHKEANKNVLGPFLSWGSLAPYSLLLRADDIRKASSDPRYQIVISFHGVQAIFDVKMDIPRDEPVLASAARHGVGHITVQHSPFTSQELNMTLPYRPATGPILLTINADDPTSDNGALVRRDGAQIKWAGLETMMLAISIH